MKIIELLFAIILTIIFIIVLSLRFERENFTNLDNLNQNNKKLVNLDNLNQNNKKLVKFCKRLNQFDKPSEHTLMLKNFRKRKLEKNNNIIKELTKEIDELQKDKHFSSIGKVNAYKCKLESKAKKQIEAINQAKRNVENRNTINLNINPV